MEKFGLFSRKRIKAMRNRCSLCGRKGKVELKTVGSGYKRVQCVNQKACDKAICGNWHKFLGFRGARYGVKG